MARHLHTKLAWQTPCRNSSKRKPGPFVTSIGPMAANYRQKLRLESHATLFAHLYGPFRALINAAYVSTAVYHNHMSLSTASKLWTHEYAW